MKRQVVLQLKEVRIDLAIKVIFFLTYHRNNFLD